MRLSLDLLKQTNVPEKIHLLLESCFQVNSFLLVFRLQTAQKTDIEITSQLCFRNQQNSQLMWTSFKGSAQMCKSVRKKKARSWTQLLPSLIRRHLQGRSPHPAAPTACFWPAPIYWTFLAVREPDWSRPDH